MTDINQPSTLLQNDIPNTSQQKPEPYKKSELNRIKVFRHIEKNQPINIYQVAKNLEMSYNTCSYIIRDLIFAGIVSERMAINENNTAVKLLTIPTTKKEGQE